MKNILLLTFILCAVTIVDAQNADSAFDENLMNQVKFNYKGANLDKAQLNKIYNLHAVRQAARAQKQFASMSPAQKEAEWKLLKAADAKFHNKVSKVMTKSQRNSLQAYKAKESEAIAQQDIYTNEKGAGMNRFDFEINQNEIQPAIRKQRRKFDEIISQEDQTKITRILHIENQNNEATAALFSNLIKQQEGPVRIKTSENGYQTFANVDHLMSYNENGCISFAQGLYGLSEELEIEQQKILESEAFATLDEKRTQLAKEKNWLVQKYKNAINSLMEEIKADRHASVAKINNNIKTIYEPSPLGKLYGATYWEKFFRDNGDDYYADARFQESFIFNREAKEAPAAYTAQTAKEKKIQRSIHDSKVYPNPARYFQNLEFTTLQDGVVKIRIIGYNGDYIGLIVDEYKSAGTHLIELDIDHLDGIYFYQITDIGGFSSVKARINK